MRQLDPQRGAPGRRGDVPLYPRLPAPRRAAVAGPRAVQQPHRGLVPGRELHPGHLEGQLGGPREPVGGAAQGVVPRGPERESGPGAARVRVVVVDPLPGVAVGVEGEVSGEEEDGRSALTALADPPALQGQGGRGGPGKHWGPLLCGAIHQSAHWAGVDVVLWGGGGGGGGIDM